MPFPGRTTNHQHTQGQKFGPYLSNRINDPPKSARDSLDQILPHEKERLNPANYARSVAEQEVSIFEIVVERLFDNFVIAMIFALRAEGAAPSLVFA